MRKILIVFLCLMMLSSSVLPCYAYAQNDIEPAMRKNPFYAGQEITYSTLDSLPTEEASVKKSYNSNTYYSNGTELYKTIRDNLVKRKKNFNLHYLSQSKLRSTSQVLNLIEKQYTYATEDSLSASGVDGDYIRWAVSDYGFRLLVTDNVSNGYYYYTINLDFRYYDSADEEAEVGKVINSFVSSIDTNKLTDYEIIKKIHDFICSKTTYDNYAAINIIGREYAATAYGALIIGKSVCQGYAVAFYRICKELGYSARFVSSPSNEGCHAWNIVELDGKYYFVDTTWDDSIIDSASSDSPYTFFLVNYDNLRAKDSSIREHKLDEKYYDTEYFWENYREFIDEADYDSENKSLISQSVISLQKNSYVYTGSEIKPGVSVTTNGTAPSYKLSYSNNKNKGRAAVNIVSAENGRILSHRNFVIVPSKMGTLSLADGGRGETSVTVKIKKPAGSISGYAIEIYKDGKWSTVKTLSASATTAKITSLSPSVTYKFRIRSFITVSDKKYYGAYSNTYIVATKPKGTNISSLTTKSKSITLKWKKVACSGYEIQYSTDKAMKKPKTITVSSSAVSKKISKLKKGKTYYFRIRAYKKYTTASKNSIKCYSAWSAKKSVKCK